MMSRLTKLLFASLLGLFFPALTVVAQHSPPTGEDIFNAFGCRGCHLVADRGGSLGPALDGVGKRLSRDQLRATLTVPRKNSTMPVFDYFTEPELEALLVYLSTL